MTSCVQKGVLSESRFVIRAITNGYNVNKPVSPDSVYDFILEKNNRLYKIQVKSNYQSVRNGYYLINFGSGFCKNTKYNPKDIDIMCVYIYEKDIFYLFPLKALPLSAKLYPDKKDHFRNCFLEAWNFDLLLI